MIRVEYLGPPEKTLLEINPNNRIQLKMIVVSLL